MFHRLPATQTQRCSNFVQKEALPELHAAVHDAVEKSYADLLPLIELTFVEASDLIEALADYQVKIIEYTRDSELSMQPPADPAYVMDLRIQLDLKLKELLGPRRFGYFQNYRIELLMQ